MITTTTTTNNNNRPMIINNEKNNNNNTDTDTDTNDDTDDYKNQQQQLVHISIGRSSHCNIKIGPNLAMPNMKNEKEMIIYTFERRMSFLYSKMSITQKKIYILMQLSMVLKTFVRCASCGYIASDFIGKKRHIKGLGILKLVFLIPWCTSRTCYKLIFSYMKRRFYVNAVVLLRNYFTKSLTSGYKNKYNCFYCNKITTNKNRIVCGNCHWAIYCDNLICKKNHKLYHRNFCDIIKSN